MMPPQPIRQLKHDMHCSFFFFFLMTRRPPRSTLFPYPTLSRSHPRLNYYVDAEPPLGLVTDFVVRAETATEAALFPIDPAAQVKAIYLQPSDNQIQLLAQALDLKVDGFVFTGRPGTRTVFGCSQALRHNLASDCSSITFANHDEFLHHWIVALEFNLDR